MSALWPAFSYSELTESCRTDPREQHFSQLLSRMRLGGDALTDDDVATLKTRVCGHHPAPHHACATCSFEYEEETEGRRRHRKRRRSEKEVVTHCVKHCPVGPSGVVLAALRPTVRAALGLLRSASLAIRAAHMYMSRLCR
jgi:ribosomal protein L32